MINVMIKCQRVHTNGRICSVDNFHDITNVTYSFFIHSLLQISSLESILLLLYFFNFLHGTIMARMHSAVDRGLQIIFIFCSICCLNKYLPKFFPRDSSSYLSRISQIIHGIIFSRLSESQVCYFRQLFFFTFSVLKVKQVNRKRKKKKKLSENRVERDKSLVRRESLN